MRILTASEARANLYRLIDQANESHKPIIISGERGNVVLLSSEDWDAIQEQLHRLSPKKRAQLSYGTLKGQIRSAENFDAELPIEVLAGFEGKIST